MRELKHTNHFCGVRFASLAKMNGDSISLQRLGAVTHPAVRGAFQLHQPRAGKGAHGRAVFMETLFIHSNARFNAGEGLHDGTISSWCIWTDSQRDSAKLFSSMFHARVRSAHMHCWYRVSAAAHALIRCERTTSLCTGTFFDIVRRFPLA
jgi:hypothetical protein